MSQIQVTDVKYYDICFFWKRREGKEGEGRSEIQGFCRFVKVSTWSQLWQIKKQCSCCIMLDSGLGNKDCD